MKLYKNHIKRTLDLTFSLVLIIILSPIILIVSLLIALKLGTPVFFKQKRIGLNNEIFTLVKFRSMTSQVDESGELLPDEIRLTKFGRLLRSSSLDELPELINILKGDMSFVGPRPLLVSYLPLYNEFQRQRHDVRPGLTGLAQVNGRNSISWEEKFENDVKYIKKHSFFFDLQILIRTIKVVVGREGISDHSTSTAIEFTGSKSN